VPRVVSLTGLICSTSANDNTSVAAIATGSAQRSGRPMRRGATVLRNAARAACVTARSSCGGGSSPASSSNPGSSRRRSRDVVSNSSS
jgi:hypothetical protein